MPILQAKGWGGKELNKSARSPASTCFLVISHGAKYRGRPANSLALIMPWIIVLLLLSHFEFLVQEFQFWGCCVCYTSWEFYHGRVLFVFSLILQCIILYRLPWVRLCPQKEGHKCNKKVIYIFKNIQIELCICAERPTVMGQHKIVVPIPVFFLKELHMRHKTTTEQEVNHQRLQPY